MKKHLLGGWTPRDTAKQLQWLARHTAFVSFGKYGLIGLAFVLIAIVFLVPALHEDDEGTRLVFTNIQEGESLRPRMLSPKFQGLDNKQQPYNLNAQYADRWDDGSVYLHKVEADITLTAGNWIAVFADEAIFNAEKKDLFIPKKVNIFHDAGYEIRTEEVHVDLAASQAYGNKHIEGQGPIGTLDADGFRMDNARRTLHFSPNVKVRIYSQKQ